MPKREERTVEVDVTLEGRLLKRNSIDVIGNHSLEFPVLLSIVPYTLEKALNEGYVSLMIDEVIYIPKDITYDSQKPITCKITAKKSGVFEGSIDEIRVHKLVFERYKADAESPAVAGQLSSEVPPADTLGEALNNAAVSEAKGQLAELAAFIDSVRNDAYKEGYNAANVEIQGVIKLQMKEIKDLKDVVNQMEADSSRIGKYVNGLIAAMEDKEKKLLEQLGEEKDSYEARLDSMNEVIKGYKKVIDENNSEIPALEMKITELNKTLEEMKAGSNENKELAKELQSEKERMAEEVKRSNQRIDELMTEKGRLEEKYLQDIRGRDGKIEELEGVIKAYNQMMKDMVRTVGVPEARRSAKGAMPAQPANNGPQSAASLENAAKYVIIKVYNDCGRNLETASKKIETIILGFDRIDPEKEGVSKKDIGVLLEYYGAKSQGYSKTEFTDDLVNVLLFIDDRVKPLIIPLEKPDAPSILCILGELRPQYDAHTPKNQQPPPLNKPVFF